MCSAFLGKIAGVQSLFAELVPKPMIISFTFS